MAKKSSKPGFLSSITGAIDDVVNEIKADVKSMTPLEERDRNKIDPRKAKEQAEHEARLTDIVNQSTSGLAESYVETDLPPLEYEEEQPNQPTKAKPNLTLPTGNLWHALKTPGVTTRLRADSCFHALTVGDIKQYYEAVANEKIAPFTLGILSLNLPALTQEEIDEDNADPDLLVLAMLKTIETEPRIYGAVGAGPRSLWADMDLLDDHLSNMLNNNPKLIALGPVGLDEPFAPYTLAQQQQQLARQLDIALDFELPVFISNRKSHAALAQTLEGKGTLPPLVYLDAIAEPADAELITRFDMYAMLRPEITTPTYPMAQAYRNLPQSKLLLGCGSSLVAPHGFSGHFNEPKYLNNTRDAAARIFAMTPDNLITLTNENLTRLFPQI